MFYRIRDDTTGCEPRKLFNGEPPAVARACLARAWRGTGGRRGFGQGAPSLAGVLTAAVDAVPAQWSSS